jgi:hypothetical protein
MDEFERLMNFMLVLAAFFVLFGAVFFTAAISLFQKAWNKEKKMAYLEGEDAGTD